MDVADAQKTRVVQLPKFLSSDEIEQISALGSGLFAEVDGAELRYDSGMFPIITREQVRFRQDSPFFDRKFPRVASQIQAAARRAERVRKLHVDCGVEVRSYNSSNDWHVAYLQANALLERKLPDLARKLDAAVREADRAEGWRLLDGPHHVRCAEYHRQCAPSGGLPDARHYDEESLVTIDVLLNDGFQGGDLCTLESDGHLAGHGFHEAGDAVVFVSHKYHCVMPLTRGQRRVLVLEFWRGPARQCPHRCGELGKHCSVEAAAASAPCSRRGVHRWCGESPCLAAHVAE